MNNFPNGVAVGRALVTVDGSGKVPIQVANFSDKDVLLRNIHVGKLSEVDSPPS